MSERYELDNEELHEFDFDGFSVLYSLTTGEWLLKYDDGGETICVVDASFYETEKDLCSRLGFTEDRLDKLKEFEKSIS